MHTCFAHAILYVYTRDLRLLLGGQRRPTLSFVLMRAGVLNPTTYCFPAKRVILTRQEKMTYRFATGRLGLNGISRRNSSLVQAESLLQLTSNQKKRQEEVMYVHTGHLLIRRFNHVGACGKVLSWPIF